MEPIQCFMVVPTKHVQRSLRRYAMSDGACPRGSYHNAMRFLDIVIDEGEYVRSDYGMDRSKYDWPVKCEHCDYIFQDKDERQLFTERIYEGTRPDGFLLTTTLREMPVGAMWNAEWLTGHEIYRGPDGLSLHVRCPTNHDWCIDSRASNCDRPDDNEHKCWVRHGVPPNITVDKNGNTCGAGAGSIQLKDWHGMLQNGKLVQC